MIFNVRKTIPIIQLKSRDKRWIEAHEEGVIMVKQNTPRDLSAA